MGFIRGDLRSGSLRLGVITRVSLIVGSLKHVYHFTNSPTRDLRDINLNMGVDGG